MVKPIPAPQKEPLLFRPGTRMMLAVLSVVSLGYFSGVWIASTRRAQKTGAYLITLVLGIWMSNAFHFGKQGYITFGITTLVLASFTRFIVPPAIETSTSYQLAKGVDVNTPFKLDAADGSGSGADYLFHAKSEVEALQRAQRARTSDLASFYSQMQAYDSQFPTLEFSDDTDVEQNFFSSENCNLFEPRKGPTVTERETISGGRPFVGTRVGPIFVGGSGKSTSHSTSISKPAEDIVEEVDEGSVVVSTRGVSFIGSKYTRHSEFKTLLSTQGNFDRLTLADSKRSTIWGVSFTNISDMWIIVAFIDAAYALSDRRLDTSSKATVDEIKNAVQEHREGTRKQLSDAYQQAYLEFEAVNDQLREYHRVYPTHVADPGPRKLPGQSEQTTESAHPDDTETQSGSGAETTQEIAPPSN